MGNGDGTFKAAINYAVGAGPAGEAIADFNGDGNPDVAVANVGDGTLSVLRGKGDGTFQTARNLKGPRTIGPISVAAADFNHDGAPDIAVALTYGNSVAVLINLR